MNAALQCESDFSVSLKLDLLERFINSLDVKKNSKYTYKRQIKPFFEWLFRKYHIKEIGLVNYQDIFEYKNHLIQSGKSAYTISGYLTVVRQFFEWLEANKIFPNIAKNVKALKKPKGFRKDCLTIAQIHEALATFDTTTVEGLRNYAIFNLLIRTGLRTVEVSRANVGDIRQSFGEAILLVQGKGRDVKDEFVLLLDQTLRPIRKYLASREKLNSNSPLFASLSDRSNGQRLTERSISWIIKGVLRLIDLDDSRLSAHSLRHTAISLSIKNGASLIQAQAMARHADPKTTMVYFHNEERIKSGGEKYIII